MSDSRGRPLPRQLLRVQRSEPEEGVLRTELRFVVYQRKCDLDEEGSTEVHRCLSSLLEISVAQVLKSSSYILLKDRAGFQRLLLTLSARVENAIKNGYDSFIESTINLLSAKIYSAEEFSEPAVPPPN